MTYGFGAKGRTRALNLMAIDNAGDLHHSLAAEADPSPDPTPDPAPDPSPAPSPSPAFSDVDPDGVHAPGIAAVAEAGITTGCAPGRFCPGDPVTRAQMATFLNRAILQN